MYKDINGKVVVVTGGARGIGLEITDKFLKNGAKTMIVLAVNESNGIKAVKKINEKYGAEKAIFMKCDVTKDLETVSSEIFNKYQVDVFINNAGILDEFELRKTIEINCISVMEWGMKFWEHMRKDKGGRGGTIFNVSSLYGFEYSPWAVYYKASKHAVMGFTKTLGHPYNYELSGVRVIGICPGFTDTLILNANIWECHKEDFKKYVANQIIQKPERVGEAAVEIFTIADSGATWVAKDNKPIELAPKY